MTYELQNIPCTTCRYYGTCSLVSDYGQEYMDKWGDIWIRRSCFTVSRISDGNIGKWFEGKGLKLKSDPHQ